jgi:hypothetical protein
MPRVKLSTKTPIHQNIDEMAIDERFSPALIDGYMDELGNTHQRPGLKNFSAPGGSGGIDGLYWWRKGKCVIAVQSGHIYKVSSDGSVEDITPAGIYMENDTRVIFTEDESRVYMANGGRIFHYDGGASHVTGSSGNRYTCILNHNGADDKKPTSGGSWETYWVSDGAPEVNPSYVIGTDANVYACIQDHVADGDMVVGSNGQVYTCIADHTSTANDKPITGANWATYWELRGVTADNWALGVAYTKSTNRPITGANYANYWRQEGADGSQWLSGLTYETSTPALYYTDYTYVSAGDASVMVDSEAPLNVTHVAFIDGYVMANHKDTSIIQFSNLDNGLVWDALDFFSAKTAGDDALALSIVWREIFIAGRDTVDYYWNDGATPFSRLEGAYIERGIAAPYSLIFADSTYFWLDHTRRFIRLNGRSPEIISTPFDKVIQGYTTVSDCMADLVEIKGRPWIIWHFPTEEKTLVYDLMLKTWYEWGKWDSGSQTYQRWLGNCVCYARDWNKWLIGGRGTGAEIWELDLDTRTDDGATIRTVRRTSLVDHDTLTRKRSKAIYIKIKRGVGFSAGSPSEVVGTDTLNYTCIRDHTSSSSDRPITGANWKFYWEQSGAAGIPWVTATSYDANMPVVTFRWKDDNKNTWGNDHQLELGKSGQTETVLSYKRLGIYKTRQWEFIMTDAVPLILCDIEEDVELLDQVNEESK